MRSGKLRHSIIIQQATESFNGNSELVSTWSTFATIWASIEPLVGREYYAARQVNAETTGKIRIRYLAALTTKMRISFGTRIFDIKGISNIEERNEEMVLYYSEVV